MKERSYIGITGATEKSDITQVAESFRKHLNSEGDRFGMVGFLVTDQTIANQPAGRSSKHAQFVDIIQLLEASQPDAENAIHYSTRDRSTLAMQIDGVFGKTGIYNAQLARTLQLNLRWPDPIEIKRIIDKFPEMKIILQLGSKILEQDSRVEIVDRLASYEGISYVLIDPSGGKGVPFNEKRVAPLFRAIDYNLPDLGIAVAGGFNDQNAINALSNLTRAIATDEFSIDAEGGLRVPAQGEKYGQFSTTKADLFIQRASSFFAPTPPIRTPR